MALWSVEMETGRIEEFREGIDGESKMGKDEWKMRDMKLQREKETGRVGGGMEEVQDCVPEQHESESGPQLD